MDSNEHITLNDLPTLIVCIKQQQPPLGTWMANKLIYGKNFWMEAMVLQDPDMKNIPVILMENLWTDVSNIDPGFTEWSLKLHLSEMHMKVDKTSKESDGHYYFQQCYKISSNWTGRKSIDVDMKNFGLQIASKCNSTWELSTGWNSHKPHLKQCEISKATVYATSEKNSYGIVEKKWFDGIVEDPNGVKVETTKVSQNDNGYSLGDLLTIVEVNEYINLDWKCSQNSYYECLAKGFQKVVLDSSFQQNKTDCEQICTPFTLPPVGIRSFPVCRVESCLDIMSKVIYDQYNAMEGHCTKSCRVKEFKFGTKKKFRNQWSKEPLVFEYRFGSPHSTNDHRSRIPVKKVRIEYPLITFISVVGTVGGTLGMFVGISFMGIAEVLVSFLMKIRECLRYCKKTNNPE